MHTWVDPLGNKVQLEKSVLYGHIFRRHPGLRRRGVKLIEQVITDPDCIARSKKDGESLLYFKKTKDTFLLLVVGTPEKNIIQIRTSFYVLNTSKGDPIIWKKISS